MMTVSKKRFFQTLGKLTFCLFAAIFVFTCEQVRDYCRPTGLHYDPSCEFCFAGKPYTLCGDGAYNPLTEGCTERENKRGTRCADESFVLLGTPCGGYTLSVGAAPEIGGTVAGNHLSKSGFDKGDQVTMLAMPTEGYKFVGWAGLDSDSGEAVSLRMDSDKSLIAMFSSKTATLVAAAFPREGGKVSIIESGATGQEVTEEYKDGDVVAVKATPEPGYTFKSWSGASTSTSQETSVTMDGGKTLVAIFEPYEYTLTVNAYPKEGGAVFIDGTVLEAGKSKEGAGAQVKALARPADGYVFDGWNGASDSKDEFVTIDVASGNMTLVANFSKQGGGTVAPVTYTLKVNANPVNGGTVLPESRSNISAGTVINISATPSGDYQFKNWTASGWANFANANSAITTVTLSTDATVTANFIHMGSGVPPDPSGTDKVTLTVVVLPSVDVGSVNGAGNYAKGATATLTAIPANGYVFNNWSGDVSSTTANPTTVTMNAHKTVTATFLRQQTQATTCTLMVHSSSHSAGSVSDGGAYEPGVPVKILATANSGYTFLGWTVTSGDGNASIDNPNSASTTVTLYGNATVMANFLQQQTTDTYKGGSTKIGGLIWMTENLNIDTPDSWCYDDDPANCAIYGRLYTWDAAKTACADLDAGWRLPDTADWRALVTYAGGTNVAGKKLKSKSGWDDFQGKSDNATDDYGFSALPGGYRIPGGFNTPVSFGYAGYMGTWWGATENSNSSDWAYCWAIHSAEDHANEDGNHRTVGFSVRCVRALSLD